MTVIRVEYRPEFPVPVKICAPMPAKNYGGFSIAEHMASLVFLDENSSGRFSYAETGFSPRTLKGMKP